MEGNFTQMKIFIVALFGMLTSMLGILAVPIYILVVSNLIDYLTGLYASNSRGQVISSYAGLRGIMKKVCMWLLIVVGVLIDNLIIYTASTIGLTMPFQFLVACIVAILLCANELISILENMKDILGDDMPKFLLPLMKNIRSQVEDKINVKEGE